MMQPLDSVAPARLLFTFGRSWRPALREYPVHLRPKVGDGLALRVQRALLIDLILDQLADGNF